MVPPVLLWCMRGRMHSAAAASAHHHPLCARSATCHPGNQSKLYVSYTCKVIVANTHTHTLCSLLTCSQNCVAAHHSCCVQPRHQETQRLPDGDGYLCPQAMRNWLQQALQRDSSALGADKSGCTTPAVPLDSMQGEVLLQVPQAPAAQHPESAAKTAGHVKCCSCHRAYHIGCLPPSLHTVYAAAAAAVAAAAAAVQQQNHQQQLKRPNLASSANGTAAEQLPQASSSAGAGLPPFFCSAACERAAVAAATTAARGVQQVGVLTDGTPLSWQLIHPAAAAAPLAPPGHAAMLLGTGAAPQYSAPQAAVLAAVLRDAHALLRGAAGQMPEVRSLQDALPWLVGGLRQQTEGGLLDLSGMHVAVLWVGATLASAALLRLHGPDMELVLVATQPELQRHRLAATLVACLERFAVLEARATCAWAPALGGRALPRVGASVLPTGWEQSGDDAAADDGKRRQVQPLAYSAPALLGLLSPLAADAAACVASRLKDARLRGTEAAWACRVGYGAAPDLQCWLKLGQLPLLRYSFVPFLTKLLLQLSPVDAAPPEHA